MQRVCHVVLPILAAFLFLAGCSSDEEKMANHLERGQEYLQQEDYKSAEIEFKNVVQIDPKNLDAQQGLGEVYLKLGDPRGAFQAYSKVAELDPDDTDAQLKLATFHFLGKNTEESRKRVEAVLAKEPGNLQALFLLAAVEDREENLFEAELTYERILEIEPDSQRSRPARPGATPTRAGPASSILPCSCSTRSRGASGWPNGSTSGSWKSSRKTQKPCWAWPASTPAKAKRTRPKKY